MKCPRCKSEAIEVVARHHYHAAMFGKRLRGIKASRQSLVHCRGCGRNWKTAASVAALPDATSVVRCCGGFHPADLRAVLQAIEEQPTGRLFPYWGEGDGAPREGEDRSA